LSDAELISQALRGQPEAWEAIVGEYQQAVFRLAYLFLRDPDDAEDVAQETFVRAYRSLKQFDAARPLRPWLMGITANLAKNRLRSAGRYLAALRRLLFVEGEPEHGRQDRPTELAQKNSQSAALWQAVQQSDIKDQQVIYLRYFLELSEAEIAEALELPAGTVKSRLHRAIKRLRSLIERDYAALAQEWMHEA
jgi:RNA polymerase sigma-70 factor (ECF subfamily)